MQNLSFNKSHNVHFNKINENIHLTEAHLRKDRPRALKAGI